MAKSAYISRMITQARLKELLRYDPNTGHFEWIVNLGGRGGSVKIGKRAGSRDTKGKLQIKVDGTIHFAHRLCFLYMEGSFPPEHVDHVNRDATDNRWSNLRHASPSENMMNRVHIRELPRGVYKRPYGAIYAAIHVNGRLVHLGYFPTVESAHEAYMTELRKKHSFSHFVRA